MRLFVTNRSQNASLTECLSSEDGNDLKWLERWPLDDFYGKYCCSHGRNGRREGSLLLARPNAHPASYNYELGFS